MKRLRSALAGAILLCCSGFVFGLDFGAVLGINPEWKGSEGEAGGVYAFSLGPWVSASPSETFDLYLSGSVALRLEQEDWELLPVLPELGRFMIAWRPLPRLGLEAGRIRLSDPNGIIAAGLFDGLSVSAYLGGSRLSIGGYYTGFLYKDTADICMTPSDIADYLKPFDWKDPAATYFASRRGLAVLSWEAPSLAGSPHGLYLHGLGQFDLNAAADRLHSQYLSLRFLFSPLPTFAINAGAVLELTEQEEMDTKTALVLLVNVDWHPPTAWQDRATLGFRWGSGKTGKTGKTGGTDGGLGPFLPVTSISQGNVLDSALSGLTVIRAAYTLRPHDTLSLTLDGRYFLLDQAGDTDAKALGGELYASVSWAPVMDTALLLGAGAFLPGTGNVLPSGDPPQWLASLGLTLSF
jgi:hypothetical protein